MSIDHEDALAIQAHSEWPVAQKSHVRVQHGVGIFADAGATLRCVEAHIEIRVDLDHGDREVQHFADRAAGASGEGFQGHNQILGFTTHLWPQRTRHVKSCERALRRAWTDVRCPCTAERDDPGVGAGRTGAECGAGHQHPASAGY